MVSHLTPTRQPVSAILQPPAPRSLKERLYSILEESGSSEPAARAWNTVIIVAIIVATLAVIAETVDSVQRQFRALLWTIEVLSLALFGTEYLVRLWVVTCSPRYAHPIWGRLRFAVTPLALIDLFAIAPALVATRFDLRFLRIARLARVFRVLKLARYSQGIGLISRVISRKQPELLIALGFFGILLVVTSALMYFAESDVQPKVFGSIPAAMWWAVVTMTTVGYGDVYPITVFGRVVAAATALLGIAAIALPTSILGAGFLAELENSPARRHKCPRCGETWTG